METHSCLNSTPSVTSKSRLLPPVVRGSQCGSQCQALEGSLLTEFEDQIRTLEKGVARKRSLNGEKENTQSDPQPKKRRLNAHQCLPFQPVISSLRSLTQSTGSSIPTEGIIS
jgi:hypothetical protein